MTKTVLLLYWHGLGDLICLTPQLRELHRCGFKVDLICRKQAIQSQLFASCSYINKLIPVQYDTGGPAEGGKSGAIKLQQCMDLFHELSGGYDLSLEFSEMPSYVRGGKIARNNKICGFKTIDSLDLEVFISQEVENRAIRYIQQQFPNGYIFCHTMIEWHQYHNWNATEWMKKNLPDLPIVNTGVGGKYEMFFDDINVSFVLAREATHRVLSSSVFVHACDAMNISMDVVHYGKQNRHGWPLDSSKIQLIHGVI